ncbi:hypothetical protein SPSIL_048850 [Sporomusa silvacetica DSM 10669]|uniref:Helix-turn-helix domain-containing protein n=2 Tax=Sporomusa silvacetica TaxID=55504 RepID=A0ABZ3ISJ7_9FIRM
MTKDKLLTVNDVLKIIPISRSGLYSAIKRGDFHIVNVGKRIFIPTWAIDELINAPKVSNG